MKVLHLGKYFPPPFGGIEHVSVILAKALAQFVSVDLLVANSTFRHDCFTSDGYSVIRSPLMGVFASTPLCPFMPFTMRRLLAQKKYDILHIHLPNPMAHLCTYFKPKKTKLVISWHSDIIKQKGLLKLYRPFMNDLIARADAAIVATPKHVQSCPQLSHVIDKSKIHVVPFGIDVTRFELTAMVLAKVQRLREAHVGKKIIFAFGRHIYYKGFEYLVRAMKNIPDAILLLGGTGPLTESYQKIAKTDQVADRIVYPGRISDEELAAYYHACDVFCLPSVDQTEAFGIVQLEAFACKKPVVCCELDNGVTYVNQHGETGLVVAPRDPIALAQALNELLSDDLKRKKLGDQAYNRVVEKFTLSAMAQDTLKVYASVSNQ